MAPGGGRSHFCWWPLILDGTYQKVAPVILWSGLSKIGQHPGKCLAFFSSFDGIAPDFPPRQPLLCFEELPFLVWTLFKHHRGSDAQKSFFVAFCCSTELV
jgi:hypothetical protein